MKIVLLSFGDELLKGKRVNTHSLLIQHELRKRNASLDCILTLPDEENSWSKELVHHLISQDSFILCTGGLGPTNDDRVRAFFAKLYNRPLRIDQTYADQIQERFGNKYPAKTVSQIPEGAILLPNTIGSACGFVLKNCTPFPNTCVMALPGPSDELQTMLQTHLDTYLPSPQQEMFVRKLFIFNTLEHEISAFLNNPPLSVGIYPSYGYVELVLSSPNLLTIEAVEKKLINHFPFTYSFGEEDLSLEEYIKQKFTQANLTLSCAESCTGGLISAHLTSIPGSSLFFLGSAVVYSDESKKTILNIDEHLLTNYSSVSPEVGTALALACRDKFHSSFGLSIVGYLGPTGGTPSTPCGTVIISLASNKDCFQRKVHVHGTRKQCQKKAARFALSFLAETCFQSQFRSLFA